MPVYATFPLWSPGTPGFKLFADDANPPRGYFSWTDAEGVAGGPVFYMRSDDGGQNFYPEFSAWPAGPVTMEPGTNRAHSNIGT